MITKSCDFTSEMSSLPTITYGPNHRHQRDHCHSLFTCPSLPLSTIVSHSSHIFQRFPSKLDRYFLAFHHLWLCTAHRINSSALETLPDSASAHYPSATPSSAFCMTVTALRSRDRVTLILCRGPHTLFSLPGTLWQFSLSRRLGLLIPLPRMFSGVTI